MQGRFLIDRREAKVMGVGAGVAAWSGLDVTLVRVSLVVLALATGPIALFLYLLTAWIAPQR